MDLEKLLKWEDMALSSLLMVLTKWFNCDNFTLEVYSRHNVETGVWFTLKFMLPEWVGHESKRIRYVQGSSLQILQRRLIQVLDRQQLSKERLKLKENNE